MALLDATYHLNETKSKSVSVSHDISSPFQPFVWIYKAASQRIKLNQDEWNSLIIQKDDINEHLSSEQYVPMKFVFGQNTSLSFLEKYGKRMLYFEQTEWPIHPSSQPKPSTQVWMVDKTWYNLLKLQPVIDLLLGRYMNSTQELRTLFETLGYAVNTAYGPQLRKSYGDMKLLETFIAGFDTTSLEYASETGLDIRRSLDEMKILCLSELRDFVKYCLVNQRM